MKVRNTKTGGGYLYHRSHSDLVSIGNDTLTNKITEIDKK